MTGPGTGLSQGRVSACFTECRKAGRSALVTFVTAGDPSLAMTGDFLHALVAGGADLLEVGIPFSDPMADGPVIQRASERALAAGTRLAGVLEAVAGFRRSDSRTPVVLMGYLNPINRYGYAAFAQDARAAGVDGVLVVDMPVGQRGGYFDALQAAGIDPVCLVAPNTPPQRVAQIAQQASGYLYHVAVKGVTGGSSADAGDLGRRVESLREVTDLPIGVGFGIRTPGDVRAMACIADAVIVGSALVQLIEEGSQRGLPVAQVAGNLTDLVAQYREAIASVAIGEGS